MKKIILNIKLTLTAPFLTKSTDAGAYGVDYPLAKNEAGKYYFPKKLIKGCLKQALNEIADVANIKFREFAFEWLGNFNENGNWEPDRGKIYFSDFVTDATGNVETHTRISIDGSRGAVDEGALLVIEFPFAPQEEIEFNGRIIFFAEAEQSESVKKKVLKGLSWVTNLGALENINFGQLKKVELTDEIVSEVDVPSVFSDKDLFFDLVIRPQEPFCISKRRTSENLFESEIFISGAVIKGCIAETLKLIDPSESQFGSLRENLHLIRFTHAFPSESTKRPIVPPLSLIRIDSDSFFDAALRKDAFLIGTPPQSPAFSVDWKDSSDVEQHFGWEKPETILSVQTAIENNKAKDGNLYAYEKINPADFQWLGKIDLSRIDNSEMRNKTMGELRCVLKQDFFGLGKTKAIAETEILSKDTISNKVGKTQKDTNNKLIISLQTPFLLCDPRRFNESSGKTELFAEYSHTWNELFDHSAILSHFYASQSLAGGKYLHKRFQSGKPYNPFLLTDAGSVFVFDIKDKAIADEKIDQWIEKGLDLPTWAHNLYLENIDPKDFWRYLPFLPENGFGEINVDLAVHWDKLPTEITEI